jgi:hypothetical protein
MSEIQTCGRRMLEFGPWKREEGSDEWRRDRWAATKEDADREVAEFMARSPNGSMGDPQWHGPPAEQPRTCSFCGGIHPDDAIELVRLGWEVEPTGKGYKRYLNPPGSKMRHEVLMRRLRAREPEPFRGVPSVWSPLPPVKLYTPHFTPEQATAFNEALAARATPTESED